MSFFSRLPDIFFREIGLMIFRNSFNTKVIHLFFFLPLFCFYISGDRVHPQSVPVPTLTTPSYDPNVMHQTYANANQLGTVAAWDSMILQSYGFLRTQWETQIDNAITAYVNTITTQDSYNSVSAYQDYVRSSLVGQKQQAYLAWEASVETDILGQRSSFLTNRYGANLADTAESQNTFLNQLNSVTPTQLSAGQQVVSLAQQQWTQEYNGNLQAGLNDFNNSMNSMLQGYQSLVSQLNQTDANFQSNLAQIQAYENQVRSGISSSVAGMRSYLNGEDLFWNHNASYVKTTLNADGLAYKALLDQLDTNLSSNASLTTLASTMTTFLQNQATLGQTQATNYTNLIYSSGGYYPAPISAVNEYFDGSVTTGNGGLAKKIAAYYDGAISMTDLVNWMNGHGGFGVPAGKQVSSISYADLQARNADGNYCQNGGIVCGIWGLLEPYGDQERYYSSARADFINYYENDVIILIPPAWTIVRNVKQQNEVVIRMNFTLYDPAADNNAQVWGNLVTQMNGYKAGWMTNILPAIGAWETQVSAYQSQYTAWQAQRATALADAQASLASGVQSLYNKEADWIQNMQNLKAEADAKWLTSAQTLDASSGNQDSNAFGQTLSGLFNSLPSTGLNTGALAEAQNVWSSLSSINDKNLVSNSNLPDVNLLGKFTDSMNTAMTGATNISLVSATNQALLNNRMSYVNDLADSMKTERMFTDTGYQDLLASKGYSVKEFTVTDAKNGNDSKVSVIVNANGNVIGKDGKAIANTNSLPSIVESQQAMFLTTSDFIKSNCGSQLDKCDAYTEKKYEEGSVIVHDDGSITAERKMHTGKASLRFGGDAANAKDYALERTHETVTVAAPPMIRLGGGALESGAEGQSVAKAQGVLKTYSTDATIRMNGNVAGNTGIVPPHLNQNTGIVPPSAGGSSSNGLDLFGSSGVDSLIKTSLGNVDKYFSKDNMDKLSASLFANANGADAKDSRMASIASNSAQSQSQIAGLAVDLIKSVALGGMSPQAWAQSQVKQMAKSAIATVVSKTFNLSPETAALLSGAFLDKQASDKAKQELGMTGPMLSMNRLEGVTRSLAGAMYAPLAEASGYILNASARTLGSAGIMSDSQVRNFQKESRGQIDTLKMRDQKEAVKAYEEDKIQITGQLVKEIGRSGEWSPEVINQLSNAAMSWQRSNDAKESLGYKGNTLEKIAGTFKTIGSTVVGWAGEYYSGIASAMSHGLRGLGVISHDDLEAFNDQSRDIVNDIKLKDEKDAIKQFDEDKLNTYGLGLKQLGIANGMSTQDAEKLSQSFISWQKSNEAKEALGFKGSSLNNIVGFTKGIVSSVWGLAGEFYSGLGSVVAHGLNGLGVMSDQDLIAFNDTIRTTVNDIKMKDEKDAIRNWDAQEIQNYGFAVEQFGKASGMSPDLISQLSKAAVQYATREQAKSALEKHQNFMGGLEAVIAPGMLLDKFLFKDGIVGMLAKGVKGMITTAGDIGKELGLVSDNQLDNLYKQSKVWSNSVTADDLKAKTQEGIVSMYEFQRNAARDMMFTEIGKILSPAFGGMEPQQVGQVLKYYQDQKTAKEAAKDQRIKDGAQVVTVAAAAAFTVATAGAGAPAFGAIMAGGGTAIQYAALGAAFASQAYAASATGGGNNGIVAAAINTLSLAATAGSSSLFSGYVSWTPHRPDNLLTGEREVDGGWGGGVNVAVKGSESLSGYMFNGGLSFQPGSGVGINLNVSFPGSNGMPPGTFLGVNYEAGSGNYTASGGFNIYGDAGLSISAGKDGYASFGLNYNKDGKGWLNNLSGVGLTMGSDGVFTLSHQFKGSDTLNLSYNTNTH
ncbi:TIGR04388 family protein, partial [Leptospira yasudae]